MTALAASFSRGRLCVRGAWLPVALIHSRCVWFVRILTRCKEPFHMFDAHRPPPTSPAVNLLLKHHDSILPTFFRWNLFMSPYFVVWNFCVKLSPAASLNVSQLILVCREPAWFFFLIKASDMKDFSSCDSNLFSLFRLTAPGAVITKEWKFHVFWSGRVHTQSHAKSSKWRLPLCSLNSP